MSEQLLKKLQQYGQSDFYPLHMPGHKRNLSHFTDPFAIDITEINGFDNLFHAEDILLEAQQRAAALYHAEETYYLVNGSTCGILAAVSAAVPRGGRILMARNSHKASYHAAFLNGLHVTYLYPDADLRRGINGSIRPEQVSRALEEFPDICAVLITSPTYDGVVSDMEEIAEIVHRFRAVLIVDEAHGAHFSMHDMFPESALHYGADLVINSIHKTLPSLTQTALLHVQGDRVDRRVLKKYLGIYQTSSPSYVLMAGIDACVCLLSEQKQELFDRFQMQLSGLRQTLAVLKRLHLVTGQEKELGAFAFDDSKVLISTEETELTGPALAEILRRDYHLEVEMEAEHYITAIMTVADTQEGFDRLVHALLEIDSRLENKEIPACGSPYAHEKEVSACGSPYVHEKEAAACGSQYAHEKEAAAHGSLYFQNEEVMTIEAAENSGQRRMLLQEAGGQVSGEYVYLYPPGIPLIVPGERIPTELPLLLEYYKKIGLNLQGLEDHTAQWIRVVEEAK